MEGGRKKCYVCGFPLGLRRIRTPRFVKLIMSDAPDEIYVCEYCYGYYLLYGDFPWGRRVDI